MKKSMLFMVGIAIVCLLAAYSVLKRTKTEMKFSFAADIRAEQFREAIQAEVEQLKNHPWAGEYYFGDGTGVNVTLLLAPQSGFLFEWQGCLGLYDRNYGSVQQKDDIVRLSFTYPNERQGFQGISEQFVPVSWGERKYLVAPDEMIRFCNSVNSRGEPRRDIHGMHLLRIDDHKKEAIGDPGIPKKYNDYLLKKPVAAEIVSIGGVEMRPCGGGEIKDISVILNGGTGDGLLPGMELHVDEPRTVISSIIVQSATLSESKGIMTLIFEDEQMPQVGWKLSTLPRWRMSKSERGE